MGGRISSWLPGDWLEVLTSSWKLHAEMHQLAGGEVISSQAVFYSVPESILPVFALLRGGGKWSLSTCPFAMQILKVMSLFFSIWKRGKKNELFLCLLQCTVKTASIPSLPEEEGTDPFCNFTMYLFCWGKWVDKNPFLAYLLICCELLLLLFFFA